MPANWDALRSLHVAESEVEAAIARALGGAPVGRLIDIGTGTGRMIELFGPDAEQALGIDRSPEMLRLARVKLAQVGLDRAELRQGDMYALPLTSGAAGHRDHPPGAALRAESRPPPYPRRRGCSVPAAGC